MNLPAIRTALADALTSTGAVRKVFDRAPEQPPQVTPAAWFGDATAEITMGSSEMWVYDLPLTVAVNRRGAVEQEREAIDATLLPILEALRLNFTLGATTYGVPYSRYQEGAVTFANETYFGFTLTLRPKVKAAVTLSG